MSIITTQNADNNHSNSSPAVTPVGAVDAVDGIEADRFAKLVNSEEEHEAVEAAINEKTDNEFTLEELRQQFMESAFRAGFNRTIEKSKEIIKEMKG